MDDSAFRYRLSDRAKDALLSQQAALIERRAVRTAELEALLAKPILAGVAVVAPALNLSGFRAFLLTWC